MRHALLAVLIVACGHDEPSRPAASDAGRAAAEKLGGLLVSTPRNIRFSAIEPVGEPRTIAKGSGSEAAR